MKILPLVMFTSFAAAAAEVQLAIANQHHNKTPPMFEGWLRPVSDVKETTSQDQHHNIEADLQTVPKKRPTPG